MNMKRRTGWLLLAAALSLALLLAGCEQSGKEEETAGAASDGSGFVGTWVCGRATLEISPEDEGYKCLITWGGSVSEAAQWLYSCLYDSETNTLKDDGAGVKTLLVYDENGLVSSEDVYTDGAARFSLNEDGTLAWEDLKEDAGKDMAFERVEYEDWSCFGTFDNADGYAINIDLLTDNGYPVRLTLADGGEYTGFLHKERSALFGSIGNKDGEYVTVTVSYDGQRIVSVFFEAVDDGTGVEAGERIDMEP